MTNSGYPSDVSDGEWAFVAPYLTLMTEDAPKQVSSLRQVFNGLRYIVRTGVQWRFMPNDLSSWHRIYQEPPALDTGRCVRGHGTLSTHAHA